MPAYYNNPLYYAAPSLAYVPAPRLTVPSYHHTASYNDAPTTRTSAYYPNHRGRSGPYHPNHVRTAGPPNHNHRWTVAGPLNQNHQFVAQAHAPAVVYSTPPPPPPTEAEAEAEAEADARAHTTTLAHPARRRLLLDPSRTPTQNDAHAPYDSENCNYVLYSTKTCGPIYNTQYEYVPPVAWPALGPPHTPQALVPIGPGWAPRRTLRIAFDLAAGRVPGKEEPRHEGVPLAMLLRVSQGTLRGLVEGALARVLPHIYPPPAQGVTLRFWSPVHPYAVQEYIVPRDAREHYTKRLTLALHVARAYDRAAFAVPESTRRSSNDKNHFRVKAIGPRRVALDDVWLVALRGTEREDVFDVCVHYHPDSRPELVYD